MPTYCPSCNKEFHDNSVFCTECGAKTEQKNPVTATPPAPTATIPAVTVTPTTAVPPSDHETVGTGTYFGLMLLFSLPLIGLIACILMCFIPKKQNIKNYAKAHLIWSIISLILTIVVVALVSAAVTAALSYAQVMLPSPLGELFEQAGGIDALFQLLKADDLNDLTALVGDVDWSQVDVSQIDTGELTALMEQLGVSDLSELQPLLEQLGVNDLSELQPLLEGLGDSDVSELGTWIEQLGVDNVDELTALMERYGIDDIDDLRRLAELW